MHHVKEKKKDLWEYINFILKSYNNLLKNYFIWDVTAFLAKNSNMAGFADNFFQNENVTGFFFMMHQVYCKLAYIGVTGFLLKNCGDVTAFLAGKAGFVGEIS